MRDHIGSRAGPALLWQSGRLVGTKLIFVVRTLILARLLTPEDFGLVAIAVVGVELMLTLTELGMIPALVQQPDADRHQYDLAWTVGLGRGLVIAAAVFVAAPAVAAFFGEPRAVALLRFMALRPLLDGIASIRVAVLIRELRFRSLTLLHLPEALVNAVVSVGLAHAIGVWAIVVGALVSKAAYVITSYTVAPYRPRFAFDAGAARPLVQFGRWIFAVGIVSFIGRALLQAAISRRLGTAELGLYVLASRLAFLPSEFATDVVGAVAFPLYVQLRDDPERVSRIFRSLVIGLAALLVPASVVLIALAPSLASDVLGSRWDGTAPLIRVLSLAGMIGLLGDAIIPMFRGFGRPERQFAVEFVQSVVLAAAAWLLAGPVGVVGAALAWVVASSASQALGATFVRKMLTSPFTGLTPPMVAIVAASLTGGSVAWGIDQLIPGPLGFVVAVVTSTVVIIALEWTLDRWFDLGLTQDLERLFPRFRPFLRMRYEGIVASAK